MKEILLLIIICSGGLSLQAQHPLTIRLSIKVFLNPVDGLPPPSFSETKVDSIIDEMNTMMHSYKRGMSFVNEGYFYLGGIGDSLSIKHYDVQFGGVRESVEDNGELYPDSLQWREDHINIYMTKRNSTSTLAGACSFPTFIRDEAITIATNGGLNPATMLHEIGHYFNLSHTHSGSTGNCSGNGGADGISDTIKDLPCLNGYNQMAQYNYSVDYDDLTADQQKLVRDTYDNIMSYHGPSRNVLTELQLDRWHKAIRNYLTRQEVTSGLPLYIETGGTLPCDINGSSPCGCFGYPDRAYEEVDCGLDAASPSGGDILILREGTYDVTSTLLSQKVFMTATKVGDVILK